MSKEFSIGDDTMVLTSTYVTRDGMPILEVSHEDDEEDGSLWQFHAGNGDYSMDKMQLVRLDTILSIDSNLHQIADLAIGKTARREAIGSDWVVDE